MIRTWLNYKPMESELRTTPYPPSLTIPDQSLTIREIIDRFSRGQDLNVMHSVYYDGEEGEVDFDYIDPTLDPAYDLSDVTADLQRIEDNNLRLKDLTEKAIAQNKRSEAEPKGKAKPKGAKLRNEVEEPSTEGEADDLNS